MNLIFAAYSWRKAWGMQFILLWCSAWLLQWTSKEQWAMLPIFPINSVQMSNYFCLICLKKEMQFSTCLFSWKKWKKGKEKKQHKGKEERKKYVCCRQPSNALPGHWELQWELIMSRSFPRTARAELLWEVFSRHGSSFHIYCCTMCPGCPCDSAALCSAGVGNRGVPEAALAAQERFALRRKGFTWWENRGACATLQGGMHSDLKEKSSSRKGCVSSGCG